MINLPYSAGCKGYCCSKNWRHIPRIPPLNLQKKTVATEINNAKDYNQLLAEAIERKDSALFKKLIQSEAEIVLKGPNGGNIFHLMNDSISNEELITTT